MACGDALRQKKRASLRDAGSEQQTRDPAASGAAARYSMGDEHNTRKPK